MMPEGRTFEATEQSLVDRFKPEGQLDINALIALPLFLFRKHLDHVIKLPVLVRSREQE